MGIFFYFPSVYSGDREVNIVWGSCSSGYKWHPNYANLLSTIKGVGEYSQLKKAQDFKSMAMGYNSPEIIFKTTSDCDKAIIYYRLSNVECTKPKYPNGMRVGNENNCEDAFFYYNHHQKQLIQGEIQF